HRREEFLFDGIDDLPRAGCAERHDRKASDRKDLIWPERRIRCTRDMVGVDHIEEAVSSGVPELCLERVPRVHVSSPPLVWLHLASNPQLVDPQSLDPDRLSNSRCHGTTTDARAHPRQLSPREARRQQSIFIGANAVPCPARISVYDLPHALFHSRSLLL